MSRLYLPWQKYTQFNIKNIEFDNKILRATNLFDKQKDYIHHWAKSALSQWLAHITKCDDKLLFEYFGNGMDITRRIFRYIG